MKTGHSRNGYDSSQKRKEAIEAKRLQVAGCEALLEEWEAHPTPDYDYLRHLRAKVRQKKNELQAMGI